MQPYKSSREIIKVTLELIIIKMEKQRDAINTVFTLIHDEKMFRKVINTIFEAIDSDNSGLLDKPEIKTFFGMLMKHLFEDTELDSKPMTSWLLKPS
jgi:hypothetical protein